MRIKNNFHISGFALSLASKQRLGTTRKWLIVMDETGAHETTNFCVDR